MKFVVSQLSFQKIQQRRKKSKQCSVENKLKFLQSNLNCDINSVEYINYKTQLQETYDDIAEGNKVRIKCQLYKGG